ncbi:unnamed protein product [Cuscuta epithymum]|uniref:Uncharacterized protein n=1 Tax=Cuscuta epithymum TaxID=186058 RepID=A0AAV0BXY5_9ASTE|nr:unnamed protein product [Cuscuta epithymum]CAH9135977.1 unnamed protein product [Cuscuta epithymum]
MEEGSCQALSSMSGMGK